MDLLENTRVYFIRILSVASHKFNRHVECWYFMVYCDVLSVTTIWTRNCIEYSIVRFNLRDIGNVTMNKSSTSSYSAISISRDTPNTSSSSVQPSYRFYSIAILLRVPWIPLIFHLGQNLLNMCIFDARWYTIWNPRLGRTRYRIKLRLIGNNYFHIAGTLDNTQ